MQVNFSDVLFHPTELSNLDLLLLVELQSIAGKEFVGLCDNLLDSLQLLFVARREYHDQTGWPHSLRYQVVIFAPFRLFDNLSVFCGDYYMHTPIVGLGMNVGKLPTNHERLWVAAWTFVV